VSRAPEVVMAVCPCGAVVMSLATLVASGRQVVHIGCGPLAAIPPSPEVVAHSRAVADASTRPWT